MIIITGAAGFIGSALLGKFNNKGMKDIVIVDEFSSVKKKKNLEHKVYYKQVDRKDFFAWFENNYRDIQFVFHLGARTDTTEKDTQVFNILNLDYSKRLWRLCTHYQIPIVYASSAATYGNGKFGYSDEHSRIELLKPLNPYGVSKNDFDKYVLKQKEFPPFWAGLKFFNVYGPNEYHKGRMASVVFHAFNEIKNSDKLRLFKSHNPFYQDGKQLRDFIYVKDLLRVCYFLYLNRIESGIYNLGTGKARTFLELGLSVFNALHKTVNIEFTDMPEDIRNTYQYFTEADMHKLREKGYTEEFTSLEDGISDYVSNYLKVEQYL